MVDQLKQLVEQIQASPSTVVFTGAGMSTESGLPDFRSPSGLWQNVDPRRLASIDALAENRPAFNEFYRWRISNLMSVAPNQGHLLLADWERRGLIQGIVTQNVDRLHQAAGSQKVIELHGNLREVRCSQCEAVYASNCFLDSSSCPACQAALRPAVVLFGEMLPDDALDAAESLARDCSLFIVLGSSLEVSPANWFPQLAKRNKAFLAIINNTATALDYLADLFIQQPIGSTLVEIDRIISR